MSPIDAGSCGSSEPFALRVIGDDMSPEFVIAKAEDDVVLRQLMIEGDDYRLRSFNASQVDVVLNRANCDLLGIISQRAGKRRKHHKRYDETL
jgi:DNA polymerase V